VAVDLVCSVYGNDVGVRERRRSARLTQEAFANGGIVRERRRQRLYCDFPIEVEIAGEVHDSHSAAAELTDDLVLAGKGATERA
jgi:hypothetical protein